MLLTTRGKYTVGVLRGGPSHEYDISLQSGSNILQSLQNNFNVVDIIISRDGVWHSQGREKSPAKILPQLDVVFNALHGNFGEDGKVQRILEQFAIPYTGSRPIPSALSLNKILTQKHLSPRGILMPTSTAISHAEHSDALVSRLFREFPQPSIIKPVTGGSSVGVTVAYTFDEFKQGIETALRFSPIAIVEEYIVGKEVSVVVIDAVDAQSSFALLPSEISRKKDVRHFDYMMKCDLNTRDCILEADISFDVKRQIQEIAIDSHKALGLRHYSSSDFIVSPKRGVYLLEVNSLPGLTSQSLLPKSLEYAGISIDEFANHAISLALKN